MHLPEGRLAARRSAALIPVLLVAAACATVCHTQSFGDPPPSASGTVRNVSEKFREKEVRQLYQLLNSAEFQAPLTNYNCGDPVPRLTFSVSLQPKTHTSHGM